MIARKIQKKVNGYRISWSEKNQRFNIRNSQGKLVGHAYTMAMAIEECKTAKKSA